MMRIIFRIGAGLITFIIGITVTGAWIMAHQYNVDRIATSDSDKRSLPCLPFQRDPGSVKYLLAHGAKVDSTADDCIMMEPSPRGVTLLMQSSSRGETEIVKVLLASHANVNASNSYGDTPLSYAVWGKHLDVMRLLLKKGANVNAKAEAGRTPLMEASGEGSVEIIDCLLEDGADINVPDENGTTALMFAAAFKRDEAMAMLLKRGANANLKDRRGRTASDYAKNGFPMEYVIVKM